MRHVTPAPILALLLVALALAGDRSELPSRGALTRFQVLVGQWRGVGQPRRGSNDGAWTESAQWSWDFSGRQPSLTFQGEKGKYFRELVLRQTDKSDEFELIVKAPGESEPRRFIGTADNDGNLTVESREVGRDQPERISLRAVAKGDRLVVLLERRSPHGDRFIRLAEIGYTRQGSDFGKGTTQIECVVTGGLGTIPVVHEGQTYYVCCAGCRDLFQAKPAEILAEYRAKKKPSQKK